MRAQQAAEDGLARALVSQARQAAAEGDRARAEVLAANAPALRESPVARGVLAQFAGRERPRLLARRAVRPGCRLVRLSADGSHVLCQTPTRVWLLPSDALDAATHALEVDNETATFMGDGAAVLLSHGRARFSVWAPGTAPALLPRPEHATRWDAPRPGDLALSSANGGSYLMDRRQLQTATGMMNDLEGVLDGSWALARDDVHALFRVDPGAPPRVSLLGQAPGARASAPIGDDALVATTDALQRIQPGGHVQAVPLGRAPPFDVQASADERSIAVGHADGSMSLWRGDLTGPVAVFPGHGARVASVAFEQEGRWLASSSWDGDVRRWSLDALEVDPVALRDTVESAWGLSLSEALREADAP